MAATFDPTRYLKKIEVGRKGSGAFADYLEVKHRLLWVRSEHPDAHMESRLEQLGADLVVMSARVGLSNGAEASGHGSCRTSEPDAVEKAETAALGRALASLGYGTQFALYEESHVVDAPAGAAGEGGERGLNQMEPPAEALPELMPADPAEVVAWFRARVAGMPGIEGDVRTRQEVAKRVALGLRAAGLQDPVRLATYETLTGTDSGMAMDLRALALLAKLMENATAVEVLREIGEGALARGGRPGSNGRTQGVRR